MNGLPNGARVPVQLISPLEDAPDERESTNSDRSQDSETDEETQQPPRYTWQNHLPHVHT